MTGRFQIEHKEKGDYALDSVKVFREQFEPLGYKISKIQPYGWVAPELPADEPAEPKTAKKSADADSK
jgi:hypothetical protein